MAHVLEPERNIELGMEKNARKKNLINLHDIEVMDYVQHPLIEITTRVVEKRDLE